MFSVNRCLLALCVLTLCGCAAYTETELAALGRKGLPEPTFNLLKNGEPLSIPALITLHRHGVATQTVVRHLDKYGIDTLITPADARELRQAGVSAAVREAAFVASERFAERYAGDVPLTHSGIGFDDAWYDDGGLGLDEPL